MYLYYLLFSEYILTILKIESSKKKSNLITNNKENIYNKKK